MAAGAPLVFVAHFLEESPGFVQWFNAHVSRGITPEVFWTVNLTALAITITLSAAEWFAPSGPTDALLFGWLSLLFAANALFHIAGSLADRAYVPGLVTAVLFYVPFYAALARYVFRTGRVGRAAMASVALAGAAPMLAHGYLIVFRGSRLF